MKADTFLASIEIMRPINCIIGSLTIVIGLLNTRLYVSNEVLFINILLGCLTYFFLAGSSMIINDIYGINEDTLNRPTRVLVSQRLTLKQAKYLFVGTFGIAILIAIFNSLLFNLGILNVIFIIIFGFVGWFYSAWAKDKGFLGNLVVGFSFSFGLIYGALLNSRDIPIFIYFFFMTSFSLLVAREIIKGCEDIEGDKSENIKTLAIVLGLKKALLISIIFQIIAIVFFILPIFVGIINPLLFFIFMIIGLLVVSYALVNSLKFKLEKEDFSRISLTLKISSLLGLVAFIFASI